jgi:hypothetical protein
MRLPRLQDQVARPGQFQRRERQDRLGQPLVGNVDGGKPVIPASFKLFQTAKGIGIGSTVSKLKSRYPHVKQVPRTTTYFIPGPGKANTNFQTVSGKIVGVVINNGLQG